MFSAPYAYHFRSPRRRGNQTLVLRPCHKPPRSLPQTIRGAWRTSRPPFPLATRVSQKSKGLGGVCSRARINHYVIGTGTTSMQKSLGLVLGSLLRSSTRPTYSSILVSSQPTRLGLEPVDTIQVLPVCPQKPVIHELRSPVESSMISPSISMTVKGTLPLRIRPTSKLRPTTSARSSWF